MTTTTTFTRLQVEHALPTDSVTTTTFARLQVEDALPADWRDHYRYVQHLGGGLIELLAHVDGDMVRSLRDVDLRCQRHPGAHLVVTSALSPPS